MWDCGFTSIFVAGVIHGWYNVGKVPWFARMGGVVARHYLYECGVCDADQMLRTWKSVVFAGVFPGRCPGLR